MKYLTEASYVEPCLLEQSYLRESCVRWTLSFDNLDKALVFADTFVMSCNVGFPYGKGIP